MKKIIVFIGLLIICQSQLHSQDKQHQEDINKRVNYFPEKGDFSIGINIEPLVNFIGNSFNGYGTNGTKNILGNVGGAVLNLDVVPKPSISLMGKYLFKNNYAARINLGVLSSNILQTAYVKSDLYDISNPLSLENLIDKVNTNNLGLMLTLGVEKRVGKKRIQGIFSTDLLLGYQSANINYQYANTLTNLNSKPTASNIMPGFDAAGYRTISKISGDNYYVGGTLNVGVEYFLAPKIAIGTEASLLIYYKMNSSGYEVREGLNVYTNQLEERSFLNTPGNRSLVFGTDNLAAKLYLSFYF